MLNRRVFTGSLGATLAFAPSVQARRRHDRLALWRNAGGPHLRGAVFSQRRVYRALDGETFLGAGPVGPPVSRAALLSLADLGANLAVWSGPGPFAERAPYGPDPVIEAHIAAWLDACRQAGLYSVLAFRSGPGRSAFSFHPDEDWYPRALFDERVWRCEIRQQAWARMTAWSLSRFGDHPACAGVLAMVEPNPESAGVEQAWPAFARRIVEACADRDVAAPLLISPSGWADGARAGDIADLLGEDVGLVVHGWSPHRYTHEAGPRPASAALPAPASHGPAWACLEFGAVDAAPERAAFIEERIASLQTQGANWAAWRWTSGWRPYERQENTMNLAIDREVADVLRRAFAGAARRPS